MFRLLNPFMATLLRSRLHRLLSRQIMLLSFTGRISGQRYTVPVGYVETDDALLTRTEARWWRNLRGGASVTVRLRGQTRAGTAELITSLEGMRASYAAIQRLSPGYGRSLGVAFGPDGQPAIEDIERVRQAGHVAIRVRLD